MGVRVMVRLAPLPPITIPAKSTNAVLLLEAVTTAVATSESISLILIPMTPVVVSSSIVRSAIAPTVGASLTA